MSKGCIRDIIKEEDAGSGNKLNMGVKKEESNVVDRRKIHARGGAFAWINKELVLTIRYRGLLKNIGLEDAF